MSLDAVDLDVGDPIEEGAFRPSALGMLGRTLAVDDPPPDHEEVPLDELRGERLTSLVADHAHSLGDVDAVVAASSWTNHLATVLVPGMLAAWTLADVGVDASAANLDLHLDGTRPARCQVRDPTRVWRGRPDRDRTLSTLFAGTLEPLLENCEASAELPPRLGWTHVGNVVAYLFDRLEELDVVPADGDDRRHLLETPDPTWCGGPNPLTDAVRYESVPGDRTPETYQVRTACCLKVAIPDKEPCASCPRIEADRRARLLRERRREL